MIRVRLERGVERLWYGDNPVRFALAPLSWLYCALAALRRRAYRRGLFTQTRLPTRVVVVGNISVGGTGKTPLTIAIAQHLQNRGMRVGVICGAYRARSDHWPRRVDAASPAREVGDEALVIARNVAAPVFAGPKRVAAGQALLSETPCDVVISDDGLQHYALQRDIEIALVDGARGLGNGLCLPAGPLREAASRLAEVAAVVTLDPPRGPGYGMRLVADQAVALKDPGRRLALAEFRDTPVNAVAGTGNPTRFFHMLRDAGLQVCEHRYADHHPYRPSDLDFGDGLPILMTEKDAVKCLSFAGDGIWYVPLQVRLDASFEDWLVSELQ
jgi:tetraacyldisaccharide 4'-kinase